MKETNTKTVINIKADKKVKEQAKLVAARLGIPLGTLVNAYLKQLIREGAVSFSYAPKMTAYLEGIATGARADYLAGKNISGPFSTPQEIRKHLNSL